MSTGESPMYLFNDFTARVAREKAIRLDNKMLEMPISGLMALGGAFHFVDDKDSMLHAVNQMDDNLSALVAEIIAVKIAEVLEADQFSKRRGY